MDMRDQTDPATMAGVRNTHRDMRGNVIGGKNLYGQNFGTKANNGGVQGSTVDGSRLGNPSTPGLNKWRAMNPNPGVTDTAPGYAIRKMKDQTAAAPDGSQLLKDRQALHADMKTAGAGGLSPDMEARAKKLGVTGSSFRRVAGTLPKAAAAVAVTPPKPSPLRTAFATAPPAVQPAQQPLIANGGPATPPRQTGMGGIDPVAMANKAVKGLRSLMRNP